MLPQFNYFLRPVPFDQLRQASAAGRIVIINSSKYGVDALVFGAAQSIDHVPLPNIDLEMLAELSSEILLRRPVVHTEETQQRYIARHLKPALRAVWNDVLVPIFNKLDVSLTPSTAGPQHRIWWYPTGPLTFIPIHAAGPGQKAADVSQLIISSYVTSLNSLLRAWKRHRQGAVDGPKLLAVSQPNTPNLPPLPQSIVEVEKLVEAVHLAAARFDGFSKEDMMHLDRSDATISRVLGALDSCSWVHFACHGFQDPVIGMNSAFALHDGQLELSEIASKRLSKGQFAFLSACHAASGLKELPGEAMHLAAGLQFAGFPSVIATMWSIRDDDAPKVADHTYQYLFRNGMRGLDPSEAATALNRAILHLREDPEVTIDRWAPFIHFGI
jgi:CHAT domain-containing protein